MHSHINRRQALTRTAGLLAAGTALTARPRELAAFFTSEPTQPPCALYPDVPGIGCEMFQLSSGGLSEHKRRAALRQLQSYQTDQKSRLLGYQVNQNIDYDDDLKTFLNYHTNNVGDPFQTGSYTMNTKWMERAVLDYYARLWNAKWPHDPEDPDSYWGYVLTMGSTEGNLYGLWNGRDYLAGKCLLDDPESGDGDADREGCAPLGAVYQQANAPGENPNAFTPVAFYSEDTHYSVIKALRILNVHPFYDVGGNEYPGQCPLTSDGSWPKEVPSVDGARGPGCIDIDALVTLVDFFAARGYPALINLNYGTTFKGAYDDVETAGTRLTEVFRKHGLLEREIDYRSGRSETRNGFWIHVDGALGAAYMPFVEMAYNARRVPQRGPNFDFRLPFVHSMTMSGHKWIGAPWPCGVFMTKTRYLLRPPSRPGYIGSNDSTLAGSRNAFSAIVLWDHLARHSYVRQIEKALRLEELAEYMYRQLQALEQERGEDLWVARTPLSLTLRFRRPNPVIVLKYSLANETLDVGDERRDYSHIYIMEHVTRERLDQLLADLRQPQAFTVVPEATSQTPHVHETLRDGRPLCYVPLQGRGFHG